ncbi:MAG: type II toxin-antitoxin system VapC family toxin [Promethearchaeota archaeon]
MPTILDTCFILALFNQKDINHEKAQRILNNLQEPVYGRLYITDYILDEALTTIWARTHRKDLVVKIYNLLQDQSFVTLQYLNKSILETAWNIWKQYADWPKKPLSFTDVTIIAAMKFYGIQYLVTFDSKFNGIVEIISDRE